MNNTTRARKVNGSGNGDPKRGGSMGREHSPSHPTHPPAIWRILTCHPGTILHQECCQGLFWIPVRAIKPRCQRRRGSPLRVKRKVGGGQGERIGGTNATILFFMTHSEIVNRWFRKLERIHKRKKKTVDDTCPLYVCIYQCTYLPVNVYKNMNLYGPKGKLFDSFGNCRSKLYSSDRECWKTGT